MLGKNIYASDGVTLLQDLDILNSPSTPPIATAQTTAIKSNASTQAKGLTPFGGGGGGGGGGAINTDGLPEGVVNKYFTNRRAQDAVGAAVYCVAAGTNTYTGTLAPVPTVYNTNDTYVVKFTNACTGASTLNLNALGAKAIQLNGAALTTGQIPANSTLDLLYDGTQFQIVGLSGSGGAVATTATDLENTYFGGLM